MRRTLLVTALVAGLMAGAGVAGAAPARPVGHGAAAVPNFWVLTADGTLSRHDGRLPLLPSRRVRVTGLAGDRLVGIDVRPATGALYAIGAAGQLYTLDTTSGAATRVGTPTVAVGRAVGLDFNPTVDRIRVITSAGTNLRLHPDTGALAATDGALAYAGTDAGAGRTPTAAAAGYTNSVAGATTTTLYAIDSARDVLVTQGTAAGVTPAVSPNTGQLFTVGRLGLDVGSTNGFDIDGRRGTALAAVQSGRLPVTLLATVDLNTGRARVVSVLLSSAVVGLAITG